MLNDIMDAVTTRIHELFGENYAIYTDAVEQGLEEPCFFVQFLEPSRKPMIGRRSYQSADLCIQYLTGVMEQPSREWNRAADILADGLEYITLKDGSLLRGTQKRWQVVEGILNFFVSCNMFLIEPGEEKETMGIIDMKGVDKIGKNEE